LAQALSARFQRRDLVRLPGFAQTPGPAGMRGFLPPALDCIARKVRCGTQRLRRRHWFWRIARRLHAPPERRGQPQAAAFLVIATLLALIRTTDGDAQGRWRLPVNRYVVLYLATLIVMVPIDFLFLGVVAKGFFASQVGDMLGEIRPAPAILFYLLYVIGILIFVSASAMATWQSTLLYGALFGFFCYATFELTSLSLLKHWTWPVVIVDVAWGSFVTALSSTLGLTIANWITPKI
jgi:uncharacterized membrane protein